MGKFIDPNKEYLSDDVYLYSEGLEALFISEGIEGVVNRWVDKIIPIYRMVRSHKKFEKKLMKDADNILYLNRDEFSDFLQMYITARAKKHGIKQNG
jgi:hypothetical protein